MGKNKPKQPAPPIQMQTKRMSPEQILQQANQLKDKFSATMGKCDQMRSDGISESMVGMIRIVQKLLEDRAADDARIKSLEKQLEEFKKGLKTKKIPEPEKK